MAVSMDLNPMMIDTLLSLWKSKLPFCTQWAFFAWNFSLRFAILAFGHSRPKAAASWRSRLDTFRQLFNTCLHIIDRFYHILTTRRRFFFQPCQERERERERDLLWVGWGKEKRGMANHTPAPGHAHAYTYTYVHNSWQQRSKKKGREAKQHVSAVNQQPD